MVKIKLTETIVDSITQAHMEFNKSRSVYYQLTYREWLWLYWYCRVEAWNLDAPGSLEFTDERRAIEFMLKYG